MAVQGKGFARVVGELESIRRGEAQGLEDHDWVEL